MSARAATMASGLVARAEGKAYERSSICILRPVSGMRHVLNAGFLPMAMAAVVGDARQGARAA